MRERRQQQVLRLTLPPPCSLSLNPSPSSSSSASSSASPGVGALSELRKLSVLGRGSGGTVYKVAHKHTGAVYALKVVRCDDEGAREADILRRVDSSEHVVRCVGVFTGGFGEVEGGAGGGAGELCLVMEYMDAGSLHDVLREKKRLPEQIISGLVVSVLKGLQYLHGLGIVHGDVKPSNLLVNSRGQVKLADFGASRAAADHVHRGGTCPYMSPERMDPERWGGCGDGGAAGDVWSLGVVAMECFVGRFPLVGPGQRLDWVTLMCAVCFGDVESVAKMGSPEFEGFCQRCLERDWRRRGTVEELLLHPFVDNSQTSNIGIEYGDIVSYVNLSD